MNSNNNNNNNDYGLVDNVNTSHIRDSYIQSEFENARPPVQVGQPALNVNKKMPGVNYGTGNFDQREGGYIPGGTILEDRTVMLTDADVVSIHEYSHNTSTEHERKVRLEQQRAMKDNTFAKSIKSFRGLSRVYSA